MKIKYDQAMPYAEAFFSDIGNAQGFEVGKLSASQLSDADILLVRSTTKITAELLDMAPNLKFVGTATAGFDHFDVSALNHRNIQWSASPGCNARAVAEYVLAAVLHYCQNNSCDISTLSIAVVGVGEVGSRVSQLFKALNLQVVEYDPPKQLRDDTFTSAPLDDVLDADIISLHTPLTKTGQFPTFHMFDQDKLLDLTSSQLFINAARGEVVESEFLHQVTQVAPTLIFDCWENEPEINRDLIPKCLLTTAHIAGHSLEGKARGTYMLYAKLCDIFWLRGDLTLKDFLPDFPASEALLNVQNEINKQGLTQRLLHQLVTCFYDIKNDDSFFRQHMAKSASISEIRRHYPIRREFDAISLKIDDRNTQQQLLDLGFSVTSDSI
ncbi:4-phosphoerythronate dehydrogenase [Glaciecola sp. 1036]|uniref:4-phosphoerythronate dehydrogenase n=1 Tax=Alteromonadaceae TaxID=72275 RepID=UPI003D02543C